MQTFLGQITQSQCDILPINSCIGFRKFQMSNFWNCLIGNSKNVLSFTNVATTNLVNTWCTWFLLKSHYTTYWCQSTGTLPDCGVTSNETNDEQKCPNANDNRSRDKGIHVFEEVIIVVICNEDIRSSIAQYPSSRLEQETTRCSISHDQEIATGKIRTD